MEVPPSRIEHGQLTGPQTQEGLDHQGRPVVPFPALEGAHIDTAERGGFLAGEPRAGEAQPVEVFQFGVEDGDRLHPLETAGNGRTPGKAFRLNGLGLRARFR